MVRIGLGIASDRVRAVGVRAGEVLWAIEGDRSADGDIAADIVTLLRHATLSRWPRSVVFVAIGPAASQTKLLTGLPTIAGDAALRSIVREGTPRFFLRNGIPLVTSGVRVQEPGSLWAVAFDEPEVRAIESACRTLGVRLRMIVPSIVALPLALEGGSTEWSDGEVRCEVAFAEGKMTSTRRLLLRAEEQRDRACAPVVVASMRTIGEEAWRFADAYGATQVRDDEPLALRSSSGELNDSSAKRGVRIAAGALLLTLSAALAAPLMTRAMEARRIAVQLAVIAPRSRQAERQAADLGRMSAALTEIARFDASRRSILTLLAELTRALPQGGALVTVHIDSAGGIVSLLAPRASSALAALDSIAHVTALQILGPVTKELVGTRELERATVQFRFDSTMRRAQ